MRSATEARVVHLIPPPQKADNEYIAHHHEKSYARQGIATLGVSPPELRLKFWRLQARILSKICRNLRVDVMMPPKAAIYRGFLRPEYYAEDTTHANELYGELVLRAVEAESDPSAAAVAEIHNAIESGQARLLIYNPQTESPVTRNVRTAAEQKQLPIVEMTETLPEGQTYLQWMDAQISALQNALD